MHFYFFLIRRVQKAQPQAITIMNLKCITLNIVWMLKTDRQIALLILDGPKVPVFQEKSRMYKYRESS